MKVFIYEQMKKNNDVAAIKERWSYSLCKFPINPNFRIKGHDHQREQQIG